MFSVDKFLIPCLKSKT
ncbi:hypothetical protein CAEBREN_01812 [Caenorhabditis brenneri]|uniref:Uncharacterized protein n=1 Tax=Caenorhabditis brenneri TaxID=135651 RepID=G0M7X8_CAEBE|nr:hypothetical protein CAEBREN_01812 [Caenorhabditis brenneri]